VTSRIGRDPHLAALGIARATVRVAASTASVFPDRLGGLEAPPAAAMHPAHASEPHQARHSFVREVISE
jgi:hypothetical protein